MTNLTVSLTLPDSVSQRIQTALQARGTSPKELLVEALTQVVRQYEVELAATQVGVLVIP